MTKDLFKNIAKIDTDHVAKSIELLPNQVRQVLDEAHLIKIPTDYAKASRVVINGMGGSNLGAGIVKSVFSDQLAAPLLIAPGYEVPAFTDKNTIYVISSYSGTTEEPLSVYAEVKKRGAKIMAITAHGEKNKLADLMMKDNIPGYIFKPDANPSGQPRLGLGYAVFGMAVILAKAGLFKIKPEDIKKTVAKLELWDKKLRPGIGTEMNAAKKAALQLFKKQPVLVGAEFLTGNLRVLRNQLCENSKNFATYLTVPELNHYAMESLANPISNKKNLIFFFFDSALYHKRVQKRIALTKKVVAKNGIEVAEIKLRGQNRFEQAMEMLQFGAWVTFYLAMLNKVNPAEIPWVDWFKKELK